MFRRTNVYVSALILLVLAGCQDSGPFALDRDFEKGPEFELFDGGWAAVLEGPSGEPNRVVNGGFVDSPSFAGWTETTTPVAVGGFAAWSVGEFGPPTFLALPHPESLDASDPPDLVGATMTGLNVDTRLTQSIDLSGVIAGSTITLAYKNRFKSFAPPPIFPSGWEAGSHDYRVEVGPAGGPATVLFQASRDGAPFFSGGGTAATAFYVPESFEISEFAGSIVELAFIMEVGPPMIVDLDDVLIFVVPPAGDDGPVAFDDLTITDAKVKLKKKKSDKDEFEIKKGEFTLGGASDGFDLDTEDVIITFGDLDPFTIEAGSFVRDDGDDGKWKFRGKKPGITHVDIRDDGRFKIKGKDLDLSEVVDLKDEAGRTVTFTLTIGDDTGSLVIDFDKKGRFKDK